MTIDYFDERCLVHIPVLRVLGLTTILQEGQKRVMSRRRARLSSISNSITDTPPLHCLLSHKYSQALLVRFLRNAVGDIVGEEDGDEISIDAPPFRAGGIVAPAELEAAIISLRDKVDALSSSLPKSDEYASLIAFIDPIDGTKEFCTGKGEQCTVCVGLADRVSGATVGGLVYRPICPERSYALGCRREGVKEAALRPPRSPGYSSVPADGGAAAAAAAAAGGKGVFLGSNGGVSTFLEALRDDLGYEARGAGGAGNKALLVLEEESACYIQDRGLCRWDTCAAQAVLEAHGGLLVKLHPLVSGDASLPPRLEPYKYLASDHPDDFVPNVSRLNKYNAADGQLSEADLAKGAPPKYAATADQIKQYKNTLGIFALASDEPAAVDAARQAITRALAKDRPAYD